MSTELSLSGGTRLPEDLAPFVVEVGERHVPGAQAILRFPNDYGASVITGYGAYGDLEMAVIAYVGDDWGLCYDTPITDDVLGYLSGDDLIAALRQVKALPPRRTMVESVNERGQIGENS